MAYKIEDQNGEDTIIVNDDEDSDEENSDSSADDITTDDDDDEGSGGDGSSKDNQSKKVKSKKEDDDEEQEKNEDFILNFKDEDMEDDEQRERLMEALKNAKTTVAQKRHFRQKLQDYEAGEQKKKPQKSSSAAKPTQAYDDSPTLIVELRQDNPWMTKEVAAEVVRQSKLNGESLAKTVKRPMVAAWLKKEKEAKQVDDATITPTRKGAGSNGNVEKNDANRDWSNATKEEIERQRNINLSKL